MAALAAVSQTCLKTVAVHKFESLKWRSVCTEDIVDQVDELMLTARRLNPVHTDDVIVDEIGAYSRQRWQQLYT